MKLRPHQIADLSSIASALRQGHRKIMTQAPVGAGKTVTAARIVSGARAKGKQPIFVVPYTVLIDQTVERFIEYGIDPREIGVIQSNHPMTDISRPVQVATAQTLAQRNINKLRSDLVIIDEAHVRHDVLLNWMEEWNGVPFIGLSATPWSAGLGKYYTTLVRNSSIVELVDQGYLTPYRIFAADHPDLSGVPVRAGEYAKGALSEAMQRGAIVGRTVAHWRKHAEGRKTLVYAVDRAHAKALQGEFEAAGIPAGYIDSYTEGEDRASILRDLTEGRLQVVTSVGCLVAGVDLPPVDCIAICRPTKSPMLAIQILGRGLRTHPGKQDTLVLDYGSVFVRLGLPEDIEEGHAELDDGTKGQNSQREKDPPKPKECPSCGYLKAPKVHQCPACGFAPERQPEVEQVDAELEELVPAAKRKINRDTSPEQKGRFFAGLQQYGIEKGYKPGWAANQYRERFGVWPNAYKNVEPQDPDQYTRNWIKSQQIRYAKRQGRRAA